MSRTIDISFNPSYFKKLGLTGKGFKEPLSRTIDHALLETENTMKREAPIDTGNLRQSIHHQKKPIYRVR